MNGLGATPVGGGVEFLVWAPRAGRVEVAVYNRDEDAAAHAGSAEPGDGRQTTPSSVHSLDGPDALGYFGGRVAEAGPGTRYRYVLDGDVAGAPADPASGFQPLGVHGPSEVIDVASFRWTDGGWGGRPLRDLVIVEVHVGTATLGGTFAELVNYVDELRELSVTAVELMPVAQFPGERNWGYDGVFPFAVQSSYGGPAGLAAFVDACHARDVAVVLDVVYNHLGPEGNVLPAFGPYFTDRYRTPWGDAVNVDGPDSDEVRRYFIENALRWFTDFHVDALRLDAIHGIVDTSASPFLAELSAATDALSERLGRPLLLIAESDLGDPAVIRSRADYGLGMHAQWSDDFHHALHASLSGERDGYYADFGEPKDLATAFRHGYVYQGARSTFRRRRHGASTTGLPAERFVVFAQNHDQIGNRLLGERLSTLVDVEGQKLAAAAVLLSPFVPLLFMGEEYGETAPFLYFVSHGDPELIRAVREGRAAEFASFAWQGEPPDPAAVTTFERSRLRRELRDDPPHAYLRTLHRELLRLRREVPALASLDRDGTVADVDPDEPRVVRVRRRADGDEALLVLNVSPEAAGSGVDVARWKTLLDTSDTRWGGSGPAPIDQDGRAMLRGHEALVLHRDRRDGA